MPKIFILIVWLWRRIYLFVYIVQQFLIIMFKMLLFLSIYKCQQVYGNEKQIYVARVKNRKSAKEVLDQLVQAAELLITPWFTAYPLP